MAKSGNWPAFTAGAAFGALAIAGILSYKRLASIDDSGVIHIERSINIGRPVENLFSAWLNVERMPQLVSLLQKVERFGADSRWVVDLDGREFVFDAQITQIIFNESIGWKSVIGPKHSGRISFSPLGDQTVLHVMMSYAPRLGRIAAVTSISGNLEHWIERGLREFKAAMEDDSLRRDSSGREPSAREAFHREPLARTGTTGAQVESSWNTGSDPIGTPGSPTAPGFISYARPPKNK